MIEFGKTLQQAREAKGLSVSEIAERTHMLSTIVAALEREDFTRIVAPIYGRGFVKLYCEAVGIEAKPLVDEFMEIYNGNREVHLRERQTPPDETLPPPPVVRDAPVPPVAPVADAEPPVAPVVDAEPPAPPVADAVPSEPPVAAEPLVAPPVPPQAEQPVTNEKNRFSRYGTPFEENHREPISVSPSVWRFGLLAAMGLAILVTVAVAIQKLYVATMTPPSDPEQKLQAEPPAPATPAKSAAPATPAKATAANPAAKRTPQKVPPLYLD